MIGNAGHHVTTTGSDLVHRYGERYVAVADAFQLRRCQSVFVNQTSGIVQP